METVNVRMEVDKVTSANVHYLAQRLGSTVKETYVLIVKVFLLERELDMAFINLENHQFAVDEPETGAEKLPFED